LADIQIKMIKDKKLIICGILLGLAVVLSVINFVQFNKGEWICIAQKCVEFTEGPEEWIAANCYDFQTEPRCTFNYQGKENTFKLSEIDATNLKSCKRYECAVEVYLRGDPNVP